MKITWLGHSAFEIITPRNLNILIDPFIRDNPACPREIEELEPDIILVTHGHKDHFGDTLELAQKNEATIIANHEHSVYLASQGLEVIGMNMGGSVQEKGIKVTMVNSNHSSDMDFIEGIGPGGSSCGYIIQLENGRRIYHSGDTSIFGDMRTVIRDLYHPHIALLPIGDRFTMGLEEAAVATEWISPEVVIPMHYNTFPIIEQDPQIFREKVIKYNPQVKVMILQPGEVYEE